MITGKENLEGAFIEAFSMEKGTREFYDFASSRALDSTTRELFQRLRDWEEHHMHYIVFLYQALQGDRTFSSYEAFMKDVSAEEMESGMPVHDAKSLFEKKSFLNDTEAIMFALEIEGKAYNLYRTLADSAADTNAQVVFSEMMSQEKKHIEELKKLKRTVV